MKKEKITHVHLCRFDFKVQYCGDIEHGTVSAWSKKNAEEKIKEVFGKEVKIICIE